MERRLVSWVAECDGGLRDVCPFRWGAIGTRRSMMGKRLEDAVGTEVGADDTVGIVAGGADGAIEAVSSSEGGGGGSMAGMLGRDAMATYAAEV